MMQQTPTQLWEKCLEIIRDNISQEQFAATFAFVKLHSFENGELILAVPSEFVKEHLEKHFLPLMASTFKRVFGNSIKSLSYYTTVVQNSDNGTIIEKTDIAPQVANGKPRNDARKSPDDVTAPQVEDLDSQLISHYSFDNYIEGESNRLARSVGEAIAKSPATTFNPLFIYGPSGCGKTHLINAIGLRIKELYPQMRVLYLSAHLFTVQYTDAVRQNKVNDFIRFYQTIDVLILDDIQELSGKMQTQTTFFHIFNHLQRNRKQIILSADRPPIAIQGLEDRLLTRFKWGMQAEIEKPTQNMRFDILSAKVKKDGLSIPQHVLKFIAENVDESVRDLEGVINSLMAYSVVYNCDIDMELVRKVMPRFVVASDREITIDDVKQCVCEHFNVKLSQMDSRTRTQQIAYARQVAMYLSSELTDQSHVQIGLHIGKRDHATVIHAIKQIKNVIDVDGTARQDIEELKSILKAARK